MTAALRKPLFAVTIALSASLLFVVEPAAAKALLPKFGAQPAYGSPASSSSR